MPLLARSLQLPLPALSSTHTSSYHHQARLVSLSPVQIAVRVAQLSGIAAVWMLVIWNIAMKFPTTDRSISIPHSVADLKVLAVTLKAYSSTHFSHVLGLFSIVFLFKQAFGIPGSALLNLLAGALYGYPAIPLISLLAASGSTIGYLLSKHIIGSVIFGGLISKTRIMSWRSAIDEQKDNLLPYLISIRTMPVVPGWFVNLASPFVGIPIGHFFISTAIGLTPFPLYMCTSCADAINFGFYDTGFKHLDSVAACHDHSSSHSSSSFKKALCTAFSIYFFRGIHA
ncbi:hypothetical protein BASA61_005575 [Batrachochytrium salamandrivorans]|nr:hypothetical protein BASA60_009062 [Batrachochytrium salamandrivorans]KAH6589512.1 hypothetical protein BASA61_005575 [Batrachochytrium salamandrivorans]